MAGGGVARHPLMRRIRNPAPISVRRIDPAVCTAGDDLDRRWLK
jgi:hypothetical protein